jgi:hypothetical protein
VVLFSGLTPGLVGLYQVNFTVPEGLAIGGAEDGPKNRRVNFVFCGLVKRGRDTARDRATPLA